MIHCAMRVGCAPASAVGDEHAKERAKKNERKKKRGAQGAAFHIVN
jgi:hypothetical protein